MISAEHARSLRVNATRVDANSRETNVHRRFIGFTPFARYSARFFNMISTRNSTSSNIANGGTFIGSAESVEKYAGVSISVFSDVNLDVYLEQSLDGSFWEFSDSGSYLASSEMSTTYNLRYRYFRLRIENNSGADSTELRACSKFHQGLPIETPLETTVSAQSFGGYGNLALAQDFAPGGASNPLDVTEWSFAQILTEDSATGSVDGIDMQISLDGGVSWIKYSELMPSVVGVVRTSIYMSLDLRGVPMLRLVNSSATDTYTGSNWTAIGA